MAKTRIEKMIESINKGLKEPVAAPLSKGIRSDVHTVIPTGIEVVDKYVIGKGGLPCGRMIEMFAEEGAGKTSFALSCIAGAQKAGAVTFLAETECALEASRPAVFGVDWDDLIKLEPGHWGQVMEQTGRCLDAMPKGTPGLFVLDSVAATKDKGEIEGIFQEKEHAARRAAAISDFMRRLGPLAVEKQVAFLFINQVRTKIGVLFGNNTSTPGGNAMKFHSSVRLCLYPGKSVKDDSGRHTGKLLSIQAVKNKFVEPWRKAKIKLDFAAGWDDRWATIYHAKEMGLLPPRVKDYDEALKVLNEHSWISGTSGRSEPEVEDAEE